MVYNKNVGTQNQNRWFTKFLDPLSAYFYIVPAAIIILIFRFFPILFVFRVSFYKWGMAGLEKFLGFGNYRELLRDPYFWQSISNTVWYAIFVVPLTLFISLFIALILNRKIGGVGFFRTVYFLPVVTSIVAISAVWKWIYHPEVGLANYILSIFHISKVAWLSNYRGIFEILTRRQLPPILAGPSVALISIIIMMVWKGLGYNIVIFLAGLQNISKTYYEAAMIDGAGGFSIFKNITWPLLSPTTFYVLIMTTIVSFQVFAPVWLMTGPPTGGPLGTTNVVVYHIYDNAFNYSRYGYASAISLVLFLVILSLTLLQRKMVEKRVHYE
jgi:multiple sugar transport system permease protein